MLPYCTVKKFLFSTPRIPFSVVGQIDMPFARLLLPVFKIELLSLNTSKTNPLQSDYTRSHELEVVRKLLVLIRILLLNRKWLSRDGTSLLELSKPFSTPDDFAS